MSPSVSLVSLSLLKVSECLAVPCECLKVSRCQIQSNLGNVLCILQVCEAISGLRDALGLNEFFDMCKSGLGKKTLYLEKLRVVWLYILT